jgi:hypothetical protein
LIADHRLNLRYYDRRLHRSGISEGEVGSIDREQQKAIKCIRMCDRLLSQLDQRRSGGVNERPHEILERIKRIRDGIRVAEAENSGIRKILNEALDLFFEVEIALSQPVSNVNCYSRGDDNYLALCSTNGSAIVGTHRLEGNRSQHYGGPIDGYTLRSTSQKNARISAIGRNDTEGSLSPAEQPSARDYNRVKLAIGYARGNLPVLSSSRPSIDSGRGLPKLDNEAIRNQGWEEGRWVKAKNY